MGQIKVLTEQIANKIAAGEVVERPSSVVKELMENSLDAHAKDITLGVHHGGQSLLKVTDDGHGMDSEDAGQCLLRHATSKIATAEDIGRIQTLGFRGEALPSIAAISRFTLVTRQPSADTGTSLKATGGTIDSVEECVARPGTTIEVADLFFNTPARKKFLKSQAAEYTSIADVFDTMALSHPRHCFHLYNNGAEVAHYPKSPDLRQRIEQVYGLEFSENLHPLNITKTAVEISGYIGTPDNTRINRSGQKFFINRRAVRSTSLSFALRYAYEEILPKNRFPVAVLFFTIDPSSVDVNIHPSKKEVRILGERFLQDILIKTVKKVFQEQGLYVRPDKPAFDKSFYDNPSNAANPEQFSFSEIREKAARWNPPAELASNAAGSSSAVSSSDQTNFQVSQQTIIDGRESNPFGIVQVLGQIHGSYILAETENGLAVFDQHAAHERIIYEEILAAFEQRPSQAQKLLLPLTLQLDLQERSLMEKYLPDFEKIGFGINSLGGGTFAVDAVPVFLSDGDSTRMLQDTLHELLEEQFSRSHEKRQKALAATLACKSRSVKAGASLAAAEMQHLIRKLGVAQNPHTCPHGRPTFFILTEHEFEKRFKRR